MSIEIAEQKWYNLYVNNNIGSFSKRHRVAFEWNWRLFHYCVSQFIGFVIFITRIALAITHNVYSLQRLNKKSIWIASYRLFSFIKIIFRLLHCGFRRLYICLCSSFKVFNIKILAPSIALCPNFYRSKRSLKKVHCLNLVFKEFRI